jgi:hypothetical protein
MRNVSDKIVDKIKTHSLCSIYIFFLLAVYEILWKNTVQPGRPPLTLQCVHIACWITKATNIHPEHTILIAFSW